MNSQGISGSSNQQAGGDIHNHHYIAGSNSVISNSQALELRELVNKICSNTLLVHPQKNPEVMLWIDLNDYCNTPVPPPKDKRSRYRFIPQQQFYRALSFLQKKLIASMEAVITNTEKTIQSNITGPVSQIKPDGGKSLICVESLVSASSTYASVESSGESNPSLETIIEIDFTSDPCISIDLLENDEGSKRILQLSMFGSIERDNTRSVFQQISRELGKNTSELGGKYYYNDEGGWNCDFCPSTGEMTDLSYKS
ncbi:hypothetical protein Q4503_11115 [Colwellia sp. 6_MG-2023]|uniref:hypothetical protein n=1 Tax=Colwellia sp. 6_MG-2023 TaxID=3062676 RepID=UPI0026E36870|nr:hypothetical protein [Colwellia sp. 6_MG-2023]MDO6488254.1 hypothetical protein [Colwellia sp. 6_MG-2023]